MKDSLHLSTLFLSWFQVAPLETPIGFAFITNSTEMTKGAPIGASGYSTWSSNSTFTPFVISEAFDTNYHIVGKGAKGADFDFVGVVTQTVPICVSLVCVISQAGSLIDCMFSLDPLEVFSEPKY